LEHRKSFWQKFRSRKLLYNLLGAIAFYVGFILLFSFSIRLYTQHGQTIKVPEVQGKNFDDAVSTLKNEKLKYSISDSSFDDSKPPLSVIDQSPKPGSLVKEYRTIYLTVNSKMAPQVQMPDLKDVSLKQASMILQSYGLKVGSLIYKPDLAKDVVLDMIVGGKSIALGEKVKKGARVDLVLGDGLGQTQIEVPNLVGYSLREAKFILDGSSLNLGALVVDNSIGNDTLDAIVYKQIPDPHDQQNKMMNAGEGVDVFLTSPEKYDGGK